MYTRSIVPALSSRLGSGKPREHLTATATSVRNLSNSSKWERALYFPASPLTSRLATGIWLLIGGSLLYYIWRKKKGTRQGRFWGKTVLITGAASDIGSATATAFSKQGATLILADLPSTQDVLVKKCSELEDLGVVKSFHVTVDMTSAEDVKKMTKFATEKSPTGRIDCFFNNTGIQGQLRALHRQSDDGYPKVMNVNAYGVFLGMKHVGNAMRNSGHGGVIVITASLAGLLGPDNMAAYAASESDIATVGMTRTGAQELAPYKIRVYAIAPAIIKGKMWDSQIKECRKRFADDETEVRKKMIDGTPLSFSEVATVVTYLCSDNSVALTGWVIPIMVVDHPSYSMH